MKKDIATPEVLPLNSLDELLSWNSSSVHPSCVSCVDLKQRKTNSGPKTLVCHDMKGGYLQDRLSQGSIGDDDEYVFYNWHKVDEFVYFSHGFITIPPVGWIEAAHTHGCMVFGTIITEWDDGQRLCEQLLRDAETRHNACAQIAAITRHYRFDGWLLNIENNLQEDDIEPLQDFIAELGSTLRTTIPHAKVLWYDAIKTDGVLDHQDQLNDHNRFFFDLCDGIFLNYEWTVEGLIHSAQEAGKRHYDVYVGADVFGRKCPGGGGFNTNVALENARANHLSAALFAQGWVYETQDNKHFLSNEDKFWRLLEGSLYTHRVKQLPISTTFDVGRGAAFFSNGKMLCNQPWTNLRCQQLQSTAEVREPGELSEDALYRHTDTALNGSTCLKLHADAGRKYHSLLACKLEIEERVLVCVAWQVLPSTGDSLPAPGAATSSPLVVRSAVKSAGDVVLDYDHDQSESSIEDRSPVVKKSRSLAPWDEGYSRTSTDLSLLNKLGISTGSDQWNISCIELTADDTDPLYITDVGVIVESSEKQDILIGALLVDSAKSLSTSVGVVSDVKWRASVQKSSNDQFKLKAELQWTGDKQLTHQMMYRVHHNDTQTDWRWLGSCHGSVYVAEIDGLYVSNEVEFALQSQKNCLQKGELQILGTATLFSDGEDQIINWQIKDMKSLL